MGQRIFCERYRKTKEKDIFLSSKDCGGDIANCDGNGVFLDAFYAYKTLKKETCNTCLVEEGGSDSEGGRHDMQTKEK